MGKVSPEKRSPEKKKNPPHGPEGQRSKADEDADEEGSTGSAESVGAQLARKMAELTL